MRNFFRTWVDFWFFIPLSLALAVGSYWFVPFILGLFGMPEGEMQYTGTAWIYDWFKSVLIFFSGTGFIYLAYRWYYAKISSYHESQDFDAAFNDLPPSFKVTTSLLIPAVLFFGYCLICLAVFK